MVGKRNASFVVFIGPAKELKRDHEWLKEVGMGKGVNVADFADWITKASGVRMTSFIPAQRLAASGADAVSQFDIASVCLFIFFRSQKK